MSNSNKLETKPGVGNEKSETPAKPVVLKGDFAAGERTIPSAPEGPDFAAGVRTILPTPEGPDFARGERTLPTSTAVGDFASGEHTLPTPPEVPDLVPPAPVAPKQKE